MNIYFKVKESKLLIYDDKNLLHTAENMGNEYYWNIKEKDFNVTKGLKTIQACVFPDNLYISQTFSVIDNNHYQFSIFLEKTKITYSVDFFYKEWKNPFTVKSFIMMFKSILISEGLTVETEEDDFIEGQSSIIIDNPLKETENIAFKLSKDMASFTEMVKLAEYQLLKENSEKLIIKIFDFPDTYQVICSQYLLWFGELLNELGIKSDISTENKNGKTFLTINTENNYELKAKIEKILYMYLALPYSEYIPLENNNTSIETKASYQLLHAQVLDFKTKIELKNSIIELKSLTNEKLKNELEEVKDKLLLLDSLEDSKIKFFGGAISIGEYEIGPIKVNPKRVIEIFKKTD